MKIEGKRVYSNEEIRQMAMVGFDNNFIEYLRTAPDSVKRIVENMLSSKQDIGELRWACHKDVSAHYENEVYRQLELPFLDKAVNTHNSQETILENVSGVTNPYADLDFSKKLELNELRVTLTYSDKCDLHNNPLERIQAVLLSSDGKKYGISLQCCRKCKKLFMKEEDLNKSEAKLKEKNIKYSVTL